MELYQLKTLISVAATGNVTRAAKILNTTPPSVSNHIRQLEEHLGITLFTRSPKGMTSTSQGKAIISKAQDILDACSDLVETARCADKEISGHVRLGTNADAAFLKLDGLIKHLFKTHPGIHLEIIASNTGDILDAVHEERLDMGFVFGSHDGNGILLSRLAVVALEIAVPMRFKDHCDKKSLARLASLPWIVPTNTCPFLARVMEKMTSQGLELSNRVFANDDITKAALIDEGAAVTVLERHEALSLEQAGRVFIWPAPWELSVPLYLSCSRQRSEDLLIRTVSTSIHNLWK
ncbi:MAG: LysR family transcriptional regulator [Desulfobacteraceae bacterium]|nr:MAG: LysR family transcriptional regulator [Desulfobacteraceae bacterium]